METCVATNLKRVMLWGVLALTALVFSASNPVWGDNAFPIPWENDRIAIYDFVKNQIASTNNGSASGELADLPDEEMIRESLGLSYSPGALDGIATHHGSPGQQTDIAERVLNALRAVLSSPNAQNLKVFYDLIQTNAAIDYLDPFFQRLFRDREIDQERLATLMFWLVKHSPDREPVKLGLGVLGFYQGPGLREMFLTLGQHDEFTLYSVIAIADNGEEPEQDIWKIAKAVHGWGRIHAVGQLSESNNPEIKSWILREGFRNNIMNEYLAYIAAEKGDLVRALRRDTNDRELFTAAGDILQALIAGGPAEDMRAYKEGSEAVELFLQRSVRLEMPLHDLLNVIAVRDYVSQKDYEWSQNPGDWSQERLATMQQLAESVIARENWPETILAALKSDDDSVFYQAHSAALSMSIDPWEIVYERQRSKPDKSYWWALMQTSDAARVSRVVALATASLPLDEIATGPSDALGLGEEFSAHSALDFILQDLARFPGQGWVLIKTALRSPVVRNRYMAINAIKEWPRTTWPEGAEDALRSAEQEEPDAEVGKALREVIGSPL